MASLSSPSRRQEETEAEDGVGAERGAAGGGVSAGDEQRWRGARGFKVDGQAAAYREAMTHIHPDEMNPGVGSGLKQRRDSPPGIIQQLN